MAALCLGSRDWPAKNDKFTSPARSRSAARSCRRTSPSGCGKRRNILYHQCFDWNAKPLRGGVALRKQRNMQWRMVGQHGVQFCVVGGGGTRDVERRLDRRMRLKGEAAVQRDVKNEPEIEIDRVERR